MQSAKKLKKIKKIWKYQKKALPLHKILVIFDKIVKLMKNTRYTYIVNTITINMIHLIQKTSYTKKKDTEYGN